MIKTSLGEMYFDIGFKCNGSINFLGETKTIQIKAKAYYEEDGISNEQMNTIEKYSNSLAEIEGIINSLVLEYDKDARNRFKPRALLFGRSGECALLCDDENEPDDGIAVCIYPHEIIVTQDEYL